MKIILLVDVKNVGKKNSVINVKDGYGKFLIQAKKAILPSKLSLDILHKQQQEQQAIDEETNKKNLALKAKIETISLNFSLRSNQNQVFGSITVKMICDLLQEKYNITLSKFNFDPNSSWTLGAHIINIHLSKTVIAKLNIIVTSFN